MSETPTEVNIGEFLARRIDRAIHSRSMKSREGFVKKAVVRYLDELNIYNLKSDLFKETIESKEIMLSAWKKPMEIDNVLKILSSIGTDKTKESVNESIKKTENELEIKYARAYKELSENA